MRGSGAGLSVSLSLEISAIESRRSVGLVFRWDKLCARMLGRELGYA